MLSSTGFQLYMFIIQSMQIGKIRLATPMPTTMDDLRRTWIEQVRAYDNMIRLLEDERQTGAMNERLGEPHRLWATLLRRWRAELERLLAEYPEP